MPISGCVAIFGDLDFDGPAYTSAAWAGNGTAAHDAATTPEPIQFTTPTIRGTTSPFSKVAYEADTPSFEPECNLDTGVGCTGQPAGAQFYPIYSAGNVIGGGSFEKTGPPRPCVWQFGGPHYTGTTDNFGGTANAEFGAPFASVFPEPGPSVDTVFTTVHRDLTSNPCNK